MKLSCGVIIIGSLIWDASPSRKEWRLNTFGKSPKLKHIPLPIRYGRESQTRSGTYTMIISNDSSTEEGQGIIIPVKDPILHFSDLEHHAYSLAKAEGIWKGDQLPSLVANWAAIGLAVNPELRTNDVRIANHVRKNWRLLYDLYPGFMPSEYTIGSDETPIVNSAGLLQLTWSKEMNRFDVILLTITKPSPRRPLNAKEIATRMIEKRDTIYFDQNRVNNITTFQDDQIEKYLAKKMR